MRLINTAYLPSGRIFILENENGYPIECTEMRDVSVDGKEHLEVREATDPRIIWKHLVDYSKKWLLTVSTQKGCVHKCKFCDVAPLPYKGNLSQHEIEDQVRSLLRFTPYVLKSSKVKIGFARMGEPAWNKDAVLEVIKNLPNISKSEGRDFNWLPCFNSILPVDAPCIRDVMEVKEQYYNGFLHFQISCNSTDEELRSQLFGGAKVFTLDNIIRTINTFKVTNRTVTLNFIVMEGVEIDINKLKKMGLNSNKFVVKLIPLNHTNNGQNSELKPYANYSNYDKLVALKEDFRKEGIPVVVDAIARCEEAGLCCGQLAQVFLK